MSECLKLPLLSVADLANNGVFDRHFTTVFRWGAGTTPSMAFPEPDAYLSGEPRWLEDTIRVWADAHDLVIDEAALDRIRAYQVGS